MFYILALCALIFVMELLSPGIDKAFNGTKHFLNYIVDHASALLGIVFLLIGVFFFRLYRETNERKPGADKVNKTNSEGNMPDEEIDLLEKYQHMLNIDGVNSDAFLIDTSSYYDNPSKYSNLFTGWYHRAELNYALKSLKSMNEYLLTAREFAKSSDEFNRELRKNKILYKFKIDKAVSVEKKEWELWEDEQELRKATIRRQTRWENFITDFLNNVNIASMTKEETLFLFTVQNLAPAEVMKDVAMQDRLYDIYFKQKKAELDSQIIDIKIKKEEKRIKGTKADLDRYNYEQSKKDDEDPSCI